MLRIFPLIFLCMPLGAQLSVEELSKKVYETNIKALPYDVNRITVRGFDGQNPPPRIEAPTRPLFYGYGMTAYYRMADSLIFFNIERVDAVHRDAQGNIIRKFVETGNRYTEGFRTYFLSLSESERKRIFFENIFLSDKKGNHLRITTEQLFCPHCE